MNDIMQLYSNIFQCASFFSFYYLVLFRVSNPLKIDEVKHSDHNSVVVTKTGLKSGLAPPSQSRIVRSWSHTEITQYWSRSRMP